MCFPAMALCTKSAWCVQESAWWKENTVTMSRQVNFNTRSKWVPEFNKSDQDPYKLHGSGGIYCKACEEEYEWKKKSEIQQHQSSRKHIKNLELKLKRGVHQAQLEDVIGPCPAKVSKSESLGIQLCEIFLSAGIPWIKLENKRLRDFLETELSLKIPSEASLRNKHLESIYLSAKESIKRALDQHPIWICVDETMDVENRHVANILMGWLDVEYHPPFLVHCGFLEKTNAARIARFVNDIICDLFPLFNSSLFKVYLTDAAPYCIHSGHDLKVFYPDLQHVTCVAHGHHRLAEEVREMFPTVNGFVSAVKKVFKKSPSRIATWKEHNPNLPLPPEPVIVHCGSWVETALFHANQHKDIRRTLELLDHGEAECVRQAKEFIHDPNLQLELPSSTAIFTFFQAPVPN